MDTEKYKSSINSILPDRDELNENYDYQTAQQANLHKAVDEKVERVNAAQLARIKLREKQEMEKLEKRKTDPKYGMSKQELQKYNDEQERIRENIAEVEVIQESPEAQAFLSKGPSDLDPYSGTTKRDVVKLLSSLNINMSLNLSRSDTYNLLGCLLTANETQLNALFKNPKIPVAIKTVIKRLLDDSRIGNIETVEKLWDRIFGKADKIALNMPTQLPTQQGIIPNTVVSREAYVIIRDSIIGK